MRGRIDRCDAATITGTLFFWAFFSSDVEAGVSEGAVAGDEDDTAAESVGSAEEGSEGDAPPPKRFFSLPSQVQPVECSRLGNNASQANTKHTRQ